MFTGDLLLAGKPGKAIAKYGPAAPFAKVASLLREADLTVGNLECSLSTRGKPVKDKTFTFRGRPEAIAALRTAGFDLVTLANNHSYDYGAEALRDTLRACRDCGVTPVGAGENIKEARRAVIVRCGHPPLTVAVLAFSNMLPKECYARADRPGTNPAYLSSIKDDIAAVRSQADIVIALFHWGTERADTPSKRQRLLAHAAAEAGADLVVGHHPHVLQGLEVRGDCIIAYSLGNFLFPSRRASTRQTMILTYRPEARGKATVQVIPCMIEGFKPRPATEKERGPMVSRMRQLCARLGTKLSADGLLVLDTGPAN
jgi:poly-gamma-glutamate synthesis protein (capsule biosynthesis protein)